MLGSLRARLRSVLAPLMAVWFAASMVEAAVVHHCPMHDGVPGGAAQVHEHHRDRAAAPHRAPEPEGHRCTCLGECCPAALSEIALPAAVTIDAPAIVTSEAAAPDRRTGTVPLRPPHRLPYANAPPHVNRA
jgi:hypothetical protein